MITLFGSHEVSDYEKWKAFFTVGISEAAEKNGIQETKAYRTADGGRVIASHTFNSMEDVEKHLAMINDPEGQAMAAQNGVVLPVTLWIVEEIAI